MAEEHSLPAPTDIIYTRVTSQCNANVKFPFLFAALATPLHHSALVSVSTYLARWSASPYVPGKCGSKHGERGISRSWIAWSWNSWDEVDRASCYWCKRSPWLPPCMQHPRTLSVWSKMPELLGIPEAIRDVNEDLCLRGVKCPVGFMAWVFLCVRLCVLGQDARERKKKRCWHVLFNRKFFFSLSLSLSTFFFLFFLRMWELV